MLECNYTFKYRVNNNFHVLTIGCGLGLDAQFIAATIITTMVTL